MQTPDGERYTRNGSFAVDEEGYLTLPEAGGCFQKTASPYRLTMRTSAWMPGAVLRCKDRQIRSGFRGGQAQAVGHYKDCGLRGL
ncbi:hypothetical protein [Enterocloster sp.]|uniref:hypothetical protein n=1 Tax=Enterocloster sp. TaxID=2719315 RepID=UPI0039A23AC8